MRDVEELCKRVIIINFGKIIYDGLLSDLVKKYSKEKIIRATSRNEIDKTKLEKLGKILKIEDRRFDLRIENEKTSEVLSQILEQFDVEDLTIEEPEIEEVIRTVFSKNG